jgi:hypothetical protein
MYGHVCSTRLLRAYAYICERMQQYLYLRMPVESTGVPLADVYIGTYLSLLVREDLFYSNAVSSAFAHTRNYDAADSTRDLRGCLPLYYSRTALLNTGG